MRLADGIETALVSQAAHITVFVDEVERLNWDHLAQS
jgi:hypothetical protein